jgi:hypothetical protein
MAIVFWCRRLIELPLSSGINESSLVFVMDSLAIRQDAGLMRVDEMTERWLKGDGRIRPCFG